MACLAAASVWAQSAVAPKIINEFYAQKISPNGEWIYSNPENGEIIIYNLKTDEYNLFYDMSLGNGNVFALDGTAVGSTDTGLSKAMVLKGQSAINPGELAKYSEASINGITANATRIVGIVRNQRSSGADDEEHQMYLPYVADLMADGNCSPITILPHPEKDFFGLTPQYCSATWVSSDGKTILGQLIDYSGMFIQPIVYRQDQAGEWSYSLPSERLFNPDHIVLPEMPVFDESLYPNPAKFMSEEMAEMYKEDMEYWKDHYMEDPDLPYPDDHLEDYMTYEEILEYNEAVMVYNEYAQEYNQKLEDYFIARYAIIDSSVSFVQNASTMNSEGTMAALTSQTLVETGELDPMEVNDTYIIDLTNDNIEKLESKYTNIFPQQVLNDGIILGATPTSAYIATYVYVPGAEDYVPIQDYMEEGNPGAVAWMNEHLVHELIVGGGGGIDPYAAEAHDDVIYDTVMLSGLGMASEDLSIFAGAVTAYMYDPAVTYMTYVFNSLTSGVKAVAISGNSVVRALKGGVLDVMGEVTDLSVVDLSGRKVFGMQNASGSVETGLNSGIYIVTYTDAQGQRVSAKCRM